MDHTITPYIRIYSPAGTQSLLFIHHLSHMLHSNANTFTFTYPLTYSSVSLVVSFATFAISS